MPFSKCGDHPETVAGQHRRDGHQARAGGDVDHMPAGDFGRRYLPYARLTPLASYDVPGLSALEDRDVKRTTVWTLR